jgi:predicted nucleic acid-binding protein
MFVIDTSVLLYAADASSPDHTSSRRLLEQAYSGSTPWFLTWGIIYEFLRVATHPRVYARPRTATEV